MRHPIIVVVILSVAACVLAQSQPASRPAPSKENTVKPLAIGSPAPDFDLPGVDGERYRLADFAKAKILVIVFTCNHCPTAQAYEGRLKKLYDDYTPRGVAIVAISPNDPKALRLDELGYTDLSDSLEEMKLRAEQQGFKFPYLYDGEQQEVSTAYGPPATPTVYIFDESRRLRYLGRIDDADREERVRSHDTRNALDALLAGREVPVARTRAFGCSTKWSDKRAIVEATMKKLAAQPVILEPVDKQAIQAIIENKTDKLRLVNVWMLSCVPCLAEFPELVTIDRMYGHRSFELVTISADWSDDREKALAFLKKQQASNRNVIYKGGNKNDIIDAIDKDWDAGMPYTLLIRPGGQVVYRHKGAIDDLELRRAIVNELGRHH